MHNKVFHTIEVYGMLHEGDTVVVGVSGGADSCALLHCLCRLRERQSLTVRACHVHHGLRGAEADRDEQFTRQLCERLQVPLTVLHADVKAEAARRKIGTEQCGREIRYAFFEEQAAPCGAKIATAHTASDNAETILFHLVRGSGITGLSGIPPCRGQIIRPLIEVTRCEVEAYCRDNGLAYMTDSTNLTKAYSRNLLRLEVMPVLQQLNPSLEHTLIGLSQRMRAVDAYLSQQAAAALAQARISGGYAVSRLQALPEAVWAAAVRTLCAELGVIPEAKHLALLRKIVYNGGTVELGGGCQAVARQGIFRIFLVTSQPSEDGCPWYGQDSLVMLNKKYDLLRMTIDVFHNSEKNSKFLLASALDYDTIPVTSCFRTRRSGDSITLPYRNVTKSVRKLMIECKVPRETRDQVLLLADGSQVLWIEGLGAGRACAITEKPRTC